MRNVLLKPADEAADELAAYQRTAAFKRRIEYQLSRPSAYAIVRQPRDFELEAYWRDCGYGHAAAIAALVEPA